MKNKKNTVYLIEKNYLDLLEKLLAKTIPSFPYEKWAIKIHMGEYGNLNYIRPPIVHCVVKVLKSKKIKPFLIDTTTLYKGRRYTVKDYQKTAWSNGFHPKTVGCPIIITNKGIPIKEKVLGEVFVAQPLKEVQGIIVLSHFKGHPEAGFGGAIKNLGMGGVTRKTKKLIHKLPQPMINYKKCVGCGTCIKACPEKAIFLEKGKPKLNSQNCFGCGICINSCPKKAMKPKKASLSELLARSCAVILKQFKKQKTFFINVLMNITECCDCFVNPGKIICPDIGILVAKDIVAIEQASFDLVNKITQGKFEEIHPKVVGKQQISWALKLKLGKKNYILEKI